MSNAVSKRQALHQHRRYNVDPKRKFVYWAIDWNCFRTLNNHMLALRRVDKKVGLPHVTTLGSRPLLDVAFFFVLKPLPQRSGNHTPSLQDRQPRADYDDSPVHCDTMRKCENAYCTPISVHNKCVRLGNNTAFEPSLECHVAMARSKSNNPHRLLAHASTSFNWTYLEPNCSDSVS